LETSGAATTATLQFSNTLHEIREADLLERPLAKIYPAVVKTVTVPLAPWEIKTLIVK